MAFDWKKASEQQGGTPMSDGIHLAKVVKLKVGLKTKAQDDMIAVTLRDKTGDIETLCTLSDEASWTLARLLSRCGVDLDKMALDGIEPRHFSKAEIAEQYLLDAETWGRVYTLDAKNPKNVDKNGNPYRRFDPMTKEEAEKKDAAAVKAIEDAQLLDPDAIPF